MEKLTAKMKTIIFDPVQPRSEGYVERLVRRRILSSLNANLKIKQIKCEKRQNGHVALYLHEIEFDIDNFKATFNFNKNIEG